MHNGTHVWYTLLKCLCVMVHMFDIPHLNVCAWYYACLLKFTQMFVRDVCAWYLWVMWLCFYAPSPIFVLQLCYQDMIVKQGLADLESLAFLFKKSYAFKDVSTMKRGLESFINEFLLITLSSLVPLKFVLCERSLFAKDSPDVWFDRTRSAAPTRRRARRK